MTPPAAAPGAPTATGPPPGPVELGAYPAKQCPVKVRNRFLPDTRDLAVPVDDPFTRMLIDDGNAFEARIFATLARVGPAGTVNIDDRVGPAGRRDDRVAATAAAMEQGAPLILAGELGATGRRRGKPDLLVKVPASGERHRYVPGDVKHHLTLTTPGNGLTIATSDPGAPWPPVPDNGCDGRPNEADLLQLAHYWRMLEGVDRAPADRPPTGAILGKETRLVWYPLTEPVWRDDTPLARYDREFALRLEIADAASAGRRIVEPVRCDECAGCEWHTNVCGPWLSAGSGHVSLIAGIGRRDTAKLDQVGITTRDQLAAVDLTIADLSAAGVNVADYTAAATGVTADDRDLRLDQLHTLDNPLTRRPAQLNALADAAIHTVADLLARPGPIPPPGAGIAKQVRLARAALGPAPVHRRDDTDPGPVPRADIEIDLDMENDPIDGGVYLWGTLLDETHRPGRQPRYRSFADLHHPLTDPTEADLLAQLWEWLHTVLDATAADGRTARVYCWHQSAELTAMRRIATRSAGHPGVPTLGQIDHLARSGHWIDLEKEAIQRLWLPDGSSIKTIAPLAGHTWPMADAGGDQSIVWYRTATTAPAGPLLSPHRITARRDAHRARRKLLAYNQADVEATRAIRHWLESDFPTVPGCAGGEPERRTPRPRP